MDERNRPLTDEELDKILPSTGYEVSKISHSVDKLCLSGCLCHPPSIFTLVLTLARSITILTALRHHYHLKALPIHTRTDTTLMQVGDQFPRFIPNFHTQIYFSK